MALTPQAPTGLAVTGGRTHVKAKWNKSRGAFAYHVRAEDAATGQTVATTDVSNSDASTVLGGLTPGGTYNVHVYATPANTGQHATQTVTLPASG